MGSTIAIHSAMQIVGNLEERSPYELDTAFDSDCVFTIRTVLFSEDRADN